MRDALGGEPGDGSVEERDAVVGVLRGRRTRCRRAASRRRWRCGCGCSRPASGDAWSRRSGRACLWPPPGGSGPASSRRCGPARRSGWSRSGGSPARSGGPSSAAGSSPWRTSTRCTVEAGTPTMPARRAGPELAGLAQRHDPPLDPGRGLVRARPRAARAILEPGHALVLVATPPLVGALAGDVHRLRRSRDRPTVLDPLAQPQPTFGRERSVTVQGGLLGPCVASTAPHSPRGPTTQRMSTTSQGTTTRSRSKAAQPSPAGDHSRSLDPAVHLAAHGEHHAQHIYTKIGVSTRAAAAPVRRAARSRRPQWVDLPIRLWALTRHRAPEHPRHRSTHR